KREELEHDQRQKEIVLDHSRGHSGVSDLYFYRRRNCNAPVELAAALAFWLASAYLLAGRGNFGVVPDPLWQPRISRPSFHRPPSHAGAHGRTLRKHDT